MLQFVSIFKDFGVSMAKRRWEQEARFRLSAVTFAVGLGAGLPAAAQDAGGPALAPVTVVAASAVAARPLTLKEAAQQAVLTNPEVLSRWHTIRAAEAERDAARGGLLPRVDLTATLGPERRDGITQNDRASGQLSITQLLFDGAATRNEVRRLDHAARVRLFEFFDTSENVALEAARAYFDVARYRELVRLAEENFVEHRAVYAQIERRVSARVARAVDLEQVTGRLALAEANLLTETANLHDTTARFQRLIGRLPTRELPLPPHLNQGIAPDAASAIAQAQRSNPALQAAIESVRSSQAALATRKASYVPRFDARLRRNQGRNDSTALGDSDATAAEIVMSWNLFNGFADRSRERQFAEQLNVARDLRDKTCRDIRQTLVIAYNDIHKLQEQIQHLEVHEAAVAKALVAYRLQFDIGQRTLLDLLDTENELFQARRAVVNARHDLHLAYARTHAAAGGLLRALELASLDTGEEGGLSQWSAAGDAAQECPAEPVVIPAVDKGALLQRAAQTANRLSLLNARERAVAESVIQAVPGSTARAAEPAPAAVDSEGVKAALEAWRAAWAARRIDDYLAAYAPEFVPPGGVTREAWEQRRRAIIGRAAGVSVEIAALATTMAGPDRATTSFLQDYRSASYSDSVRKTIDWQRVDGRWRIVSEESAPAR